MKQNGRKSPHAASVVAGNFGYKPPPPDDMNKQQVKIWNATIDGEPTVLFNSAAMQSMLQDYCRHKAMANELSSYIDKVQMGENAFIDDLDRLLRLRDREVRAAASLAARMRLTNQSRVPSSARVLAPENIVQGSAPWAG